MQWLSAFVGGVLPLFITLETLKFYHSSPSLILSIKRAPLQVIQTNRDFLHKLLESYPSEAKAVRRASIRLAVLRGTVV